MSIELDEDELPTIPPPHPGAGPCRQLFCTSLTAPNSTRCERHSRYSTPAREPSTADLLAEADALFSDLPLAAE